MSADAAIIELLDEVLAPLGAFQAKRMFGGYGLYVDAVFFAILDGGALYFKIDDLRKELYEAEGMRAFSYSTKSGTHALTSYWSVPERLYDEADEMREWAAAAVRAARQSAAKKTAKKRPSKVSGLSAKGASRKRT